MISIKGLDKAEVFKALYDKARGLGMGFIQVKDGDISIKEARAIIKESKSFKYRKLYFSYVFGRVMKVDLSKDEFNPWLYDCHMGEGSAERALKELLK